MVNAFVGAMVGMERSILPMIAEADFALKARAAVLSFIVVFGLTKAQRTISQASCPIDSVGSMCSWQDGWSRSPFRSC